MITKMWNRFYSDFLLPQRFSEYLEILLEWKNQGAIFTTASEFHRIGKNSQDRTVIVLRHDIDTDPKASLKFAEIEESLGLRGTYYFRQSTIDDKTIRQLILRGHEVGYHYEEFSDFIKLQRTFESEKLESYIDKSRHNFINNLIVLQNKFNIKITSVAAHGDFINRRLSISNSIIMNQSLQDISGVKFDFYDQDYITLFKHYVSDYAYPLFYKCDLRKIQITPGSHITFLTHPRHWRSNIILNAKDNVLRIWEGVLTFRIKKINP